MSTNKTRYFIVHSPDGRILAAAPVQINSDKNRPATPMATSCWAKPGDLRN